MTARAGADLAMVKDSSAIVCAESRDDVIVIVDAAEWRPRIGKPLVPSQVVQEAVAVACGRGCESICTDLTYRETLREAASEAGIVVLSAPTRPEEAYVLTRTLMREGRLRFELQHAPEVAAKIIRQLVGARVRPGDGGRLKVTHDRDASGHGDLVAALVLAVWSLRAEVAKTGGRAAVDPSRMRVTERMHTANEWPDDDDAPRGNLGRRF